METKAFNLRFYYMHFHNWGFKYKSKSVYIKLKALKKT